MEGEELTVAGTKGRRGTCRDRGLEVKGEKVGARGGARRVTRGTEHTRGLPTYSDF